MAPFDRAKKPYSRPSSRAGDGAWQHDLHEKAAPAPHRSLAVNQALDENNRIMVKNLHYELTPKDLMSVFGNVGTLVREPQIRYDRSGRSSGVAIITYETPEEASQAIARFNGATANGQMMTVEYAPIPTKPKRRSVSAPTSLIDRISKPPLLERLGDSKKTAEPTAPRKPRGGGPTRTKGMRPPRPGPKKPKTAEELDKELDSFMHDDPKPKSAGKEGEVAVTTSPSQTRADEDVEMAT
ncbi:RNA-binding domain-containing protein [Thelephora terrestris]|uniref:RNA-binding domain-containing protein n=1 Tax=Thelephora terrestris TaxID=56493 RepID=A0A9P6HKS2_9AGAM|nr:RNA-binding domain-containing protein [Thelephora terrestris]